jgi:hypothetical protein
MHTIPPGQPNPLPYKRSWLDPPPPHRPRFPTCAVGPARMRLALDALVSEYGDVALAEFSRRVSELEPDHRKQIRRLARRD